MHPNGSGRIQVGPNTSKRLRNLAKTMKELAIISKNFVEILYHFILIRRWASHTHPPNRRNAWTRPKPGARHGGRAGGGRVRTKKLKISESVRMHPNASECIRMHPNASEHVRTGPSKPENLKKPTKTWKNSRKPGKFCENFAKNFAKACFDLNFDFPF